MKIQVYIYHILSRASLYNFLVSLVTNLLFANPLKYCLLMYEALKQLPYKYILQIKTSCILSYLISGPNKQICQLSLLDGEIPSFWFSSCHLPVRANNLPVFVKFSFALHLFCVMRLLLIQENPFKICLFIYVTQEST